MTNTNNHNHHSNKSNNSIDIRKDNDESLNLFAIDHPPTTTTWIDVTTNFQQCAHQLTTQQPLICDANTFHLYDAMAASQLGHEKMDCCQVPLHQSTTTTTTTTTTTDARTDTTNHPTLLSSSSSSIPECVYPRPAPTGLKSPFTTLLWEEWTDAQLLGFALEILRCIQALCSGSSVGESTFTCLYAHASVLQDMEDQLFSKNEMHLSLEQMNLSSPSLPPPATGTSSLSSIPDDKNTTTTTTRLPFQGTSHQYVVYALSLSLVEITLLFRSIVQNADVYEEEDFVAQTYQIPLYSSSTRDIMSVLATAIDIVPPSLQSSLGCILSFMVGFISAISQLAKLSTTKLLDELKQVEIIVEKATQALDFLLEQQQQPPHQTSLESFPPAPAQAFDPYVYRPYVGNAPVRQVRKVEIRQSIQTLRQITCELQSCVCHILIKANSLRRLRHMLHHVSRNNVNILSRSLLVLNLYFDDRILGQYEMTSWIWKDIQEMTVIPDAYRNGQTDHVQAFLQRLAKPVYDTLKLQLLNPNRQRAYMDVIMFPEWAIIQIEAQALDAHFHYLMEANSTSLLSSSSSSSSLDPVFAPYTLIIILRLMVQFISVGFALELYCSHEDIGFAYWYLDFLLSGLLQHMSVMRQSKAAAQIEKYNKEMKRTSTTSNQRNKKKSNKLKNHPVAENIAPPAPSPQDYEIDLELSVIALKRNLCRGSLRFLAALQQAGLLKKKSYAFTSQERIFEERFRAFSAIRQPPLLEYEQYVQGSDFSNISPEELQQSTAEWFQSCKRTIEQFQSSAMASSMEDCYAPIRTAELTSLLKVCVGNSVYLHKLRQLLQDPVKMSAVHVEFDTKTHDQYCTIKLN